MTIWNEKRFLYGYKDDQVSMTYQKFRNDPRVGYLDPEFKRRLLGAFCFTVTKFKDVKVGIGGGYRTYEQQKREFLARHTKLNYVPPKNVQNGIEYRFWENNWYKLKPGFAGIAPPGRSYHESTTPDGKILAVDLVGNVEIIGYIANSFGLITFKNYGGETWHAQPYEIPKGRGDRPISYSPDKFHPLAVFDFSKYWSFPGPSS